MKGERKHIISVVLLIILIINCQLSTIQAQDAQILAQRDLMGSARYVGLAGAMTAVGGDPSAVNDNPAGLGVFRRWDVRLSLFVDADRVWQQGTKGSIGARTTCSVSQASFVFGWLDNTRERGLIGNNLMISYNNLATYNRQYTASNLNEAMSLTDVIASKTNGVDESALQPASRWDDQNWLSCQAYDTYLISPDISDPARWYSVLEAGQVVDKNQLNVREYGSIDQFGISWGGNFSNKFFLGATLNLIAIDHTQSVKYDEYFGDECGMYNDTYVHHSGFGVNGVFGVIAHPTQYVRVGASLTTPSIMTMTTTSYGDMGSTLYMPDTAGVVRLTSLSASTPENAYNDRWTTPLRFSFGVALQLKNYGLVSLQYDLAHQKEIDDIHTLRVGVEGVITDRFFLEAGYAYESTFLKNSAYTAGVLPDNTVRTDAYSQFIKSSHYATAGFGYRGKYFAVHAAYRYRWQKGVTYAHEMASAYNLNATTHNIVLTLDFHTK